jgi:3-oxosteroid 1-dehydrogenase
VIPGLYAAGNAMASPMGMTDGGAGGTLGPAMVFGYLAGRDVGERLAAGADADAALSAAPALGSTAAA